MNYHNGEGSDRLNFSTNATQHTLSFAVKNETTSNKKDRKATSFSRFLINPDYVSELDKSDGAKPYDNEDDMP